MELQYFTGLEKERGIFYAVPKIMFINAELREISLKAKIVYSLLLDRVDLSKKNGWKKDGYIYILYSQKKLAEKLGLNEKTIRNAFKELLAKNLIRCKKRGQGEAQEIWVKNLSTIDNVENDYQPDQSYTPSHKEKSSKDKKRIKELEDEVSRLKAEISLLEEKNFLPENGKNDLSTVDKNSELDGKKLPPIKTNQNKTNFIKTNSLFQRGEKKREKSLKQIKEQVLDDLKKQETLPYEYVDDDRKMEEALKVITLFDSNKELSQGKDTFFMRGLKLFISSLTKMLTSGEKQFIRGVEVSTSRIYEKVVADICYNYKGNLCLDTIVYDSIDVYEEASKNQNIKSPIKYMTACIWSVLQSENIVQEYYY